MSQILEGKEKKVKKLLKFRIWEYKWQWLVLWIFRLESYFLKKLLMVSDDSEESSDLEGEKKTI